MKHASVQATPSLQSCQHEEAPSQQKITAKTGIRRRSHRFAKRIRCKGIQTEATPVEATPAEITPVKTTSAEATCLNTTPPVASTFKRKATGPPANIPKVKRVEIIRPAFYSPTPIPLLNRINAQRELIDRERQRLQDMHNRRVAASSIVEPILDIFADDLAVDDDTYEEWLLSELQ